MHHLQSLCIFDSCREASCKICRNVMAAKADRIGVNETAFGENRDRRGAAAHVDGRAAEFDERLERTLLEVGADLLRLETGASYAEPLLAFFRRRESRLWR